MEHQVCRFHILAELNKAVLRAVAQVRKHLAAQKPKLPRGRPGTPEAKRKARRRRHLERKIGDLFEHRHLFVKRHLTPGERRTLRRISRGLPQLRALRRVVEEIYRLFDRRCRTETALSEAGPAAGSRPPLQGIEADLPEAPVPQLGEGADLPGRQPAGFDLQRRGTEQPPASQDAEDRVPGPNSTDHQRPDRAGHVSRRPRSLPRGNDEDTPPRQATIIPGDGAKVSTSRHFSARSACLPRGSARSTRRCSIRRSDMIRARPGDPRTEWRGCTQSATSTSADRSLSQH